VLTLLPLHCVSPGAQTPVQTPDEHVELTQGCAFDQLPVVSQVWTELPEQRTAFGVHTPVQAPCAHA
jgi:hypothetical protein